ncbi:MAG TPA: hypothetical protein VII94_01050 [Candidatus Saccharimonadales bacterium]
MTEPRKTSDVLLTIESVQKIMLDIIRAQDLNIKILSNKLNDVIGRLDKQQAGPPKIIVETVQTVTPPQMPMNFPQMPAGDPERTIPISAESKLPQDNSPQGFRRNSRPETYATERVQNSPQEQMAEKKFPVQLPSSIPQGARPTAPQGIRQVAAAPPPGREIDQVVSTTVTTPPTVSSKGSKVQQQTISPMSEAAYQEEWPEQQSPQGQIPTMQRCVDGNNKTVFLANVEITDLVTGRQVVKTRTNAAGKWMAPLSVGNYRVVIKKGATPATNKAALEAIQDISVDGSVTPLELPMVIVRPPK